MPFEECTSLRASDPQAADLCEILVVEMGVDPREIDAGVPAVECDMTSCSKVIQAGTAGYGPLDAGEIYEAAITLMKREEDAFAGSGGGALRKFTDLVAAKTSFRVPWPFNDFKPETRGDDEILLKVYSNISSIKGDVAAQGPAEGTFAYNRGVTERLTGWMMDRKGLGASAVDLAPKEMTQLEFMNRLAGKRTGDCTELSRLAYAIFRLAGLKPSFIYVERDAIDPTITEHMAVGLRLDPKRPDLLTTVDLYHNRILEKGHTIQSELHAAGALAVYHTNRAVRLMANSPMGCKECAKRIQGILLDALRYDPMCAIAHYNYAQFLMRFKGDYANAYAEAERALMLRPFDADFSSLKTYLGTPSFLKKHKIPNR